MWTLHRHKKGGLYLSLGPAVHSETEEVYERYLCLEPSPRGAAWLRPASMFHETLEDGRARFAPIARIRIVMPEDEPTVLAFGFDAWAEGRSMEDFLASYERSRDHLRGTRYLIESLEGEIFADLNTIRFARGLVGIASVATSPSRRRRGHATRLLQATMALFRDVDPTTRFVLFSEVPPIVYEQVGFEVVDDAHQHFRPSIAMATSLSTSPLSDDEAQVLRRYF